MVKYSSRVNPKPRKSKKKKMTTTTSQPSVTEVFGDSTGGVVSTGGNINPKVAANIGKVIKASVPTLPALKRAFGRAHLPMSGGVLPSGGILLSGGDIDSLQYPHVVHALGAMDPATFHMLQGLAATSLGSPHPLSASLKEHLGGAISKHPEDVSKAATRDILKATTPQMLSSALHSEYIDNLKGMDTGGGLFSSLKSLLKKGTAGAGKALKLFGKGAKGAVRALASGAKTADMVGKSLSNAIQQGVEIANLLAPAVGQVSGTGKALLQSGAEAGKQLQGSIGKGRNIAQALSEGLDPVVEALGRADAPLVS